MQLFLRFAEISSQRVRIIILVRDMTFVFNYQSEMTTSETTRMIDERQHEIKMSMTDETIEEATKTINHIYYNSKRSKLGFRRAFSSETDEFLDKHVHEITGTKLDLVLQRISEDGSRTTNCAYLRGSGEEKLKLYNENPEEKQAAILNVKLTFFDAVMRLGIAGKMDGQRAFIFIPESCYDLVDHLDITRCYYINCGHHRHVDDDTPREKKLVCSKCRVATYCCKECQKADWKMHKKACFPMDKIKADGAMLTRELKERLGVL